MILEPQKIKSDAVSPSICHEMMGQDAMIFVFWMLSFKPTFSLSSLTYIKRLFSSSSLSAIRVVSSAYLRLLIFLPAILIPACVSSILRVKRKVCWNVYPPYDPAVLVLVVYWLEVQSIYKMGKDFQHKILFIHKSLKLETNVHQQVNGCINCDIFI